MASAMQAFIQREFASRRSPVMGLRGMVASSQPLASEAGMRILQAGGNAADAAVAMAAALNVTEPCSTGIGGDAFALFFDAQTKTVKAAMGSGRSGAAASLQAVRERGISSTSLPAESGLCVTVPGAAALWEDVVNNWGSLSLSQVLTPAIQLAEDGFPVGPVTAGQWEACSVQLRGPGYQALLMPDGQAPGPGSVMRNRDLATTFRSLAEHGADKGFYGGRIGKAIVAAVQEQGGVLTEEDLSRHATSFPAPICTSYRGLTIYELPPPTQGLAALIAMNNLEQEVELEEKGWGSTHHLHVAIESMRLAFADALQHIADPESVEVPTERLLSKQYAASRREALYRPSQASEATPGFPGTVAPPPSGDLPQGGGDTVYFCTVDGQGNGCSFINSNFMGFGSGIVPEGCGFSLQNRGYNFILEPTHPNCLAPNKRPYHTIIPGLATDSRGNLFATFGVMGAMMQPQGHLQVLSNLVDFKMDPQAALDAPRWCVVGPDSFKGPSSAKTSRVLLEEGFENDRASQLEARGHRVSVADKSQQGIFGRGQIIMRDPETGVLWGGSDPRADGQALAW